MVTVGVVDNKMLWRGHINMKKVLYVLVIFAFCIMLPLYSFAAADGVEGPKACKQCGMDRTTFDQSRMLIVYADGISVGVCSIHCAAAELNQNRGKQVKSLMVADYMTKELTDAKAATWTMGGMKKGVMTSVGKWAFAKQADAQKFIQEYGGRMITFDEALKAAENEIAAGGSEKHEHHAHQGHGSPMQYNPAFGDDIYHTHPAGMWMLNYKFMHMDMRGLRDGTSDVPLSKVIPMKGTKYGYMMAPTEMTMDMHMFMLMYGVTNRLTVMGMLNYQRNEMDMVMNMGMRNRLEPPMRTSGLGDTDVRAIYKISDTFTGSLGLSIPTGDIEKEFVTMGMRFRDPYSMQLGSGTYDLKPALTYNSVSADGKWNWGAQAMYTWHTAKNEYDWKYGDSLKMTGWIQRAFDPFSSWLRLAYSDTGRIRGEDREIRKLLSGMMGAPTPDADPDNYGGQRLDGVVGIAFFKGPVSIGIDGGLPLYQNLNGLQMKTQWFFTTGIQVMF